jgi:hypothetical protein
VTINALLSRGAGIKRLSDPYHNAARLTPAAEHGHRPLHQSNCWKLADPTAGERCLRVASSAHDHASRKRVHVRRCAGSPCRGRSGTLASRKLVSLLHQVSTHLVTCSRWLRVSGHRALQRRQRRMLTCESQQASTLGSPIRVQRLGTVPAFTSTAGAAPHVPATLVLPATRARMAHNNYRQLPSTPPRRRVRNVSNCGPLEAAARQCATLQRQRT